MWIVDFLHERHEKKHEIIPKGDKEGFDHEHFKQRDYEYNGLQFSAYFRPLYMAFMPF